MCLFADTMPRKIDNIDYHVTDRCNLNCVSCGHFSCLVPPTVGHKTIDTIKKDLEILSCYADCFVGLTLTGGECTLHPQLDEIMQIARQYFPYNEITMYTNGTRADSMDKYKAVIHENNINVLGTYYPLVGDKFWDIPSKIDGTLNYRLNAEHFHKVFFSGNECTDDEEIYTCASRGACCQLVDGKLYPCQYAAQFKYFDEYFKGQHKLKVEGDEYIDLTAKPFKTDVVEFMYTAKFDLCKHCLDAKRNAGHYFNDTEWRQTEKKLDEWYIEEHKEETTQE